MCVFRSLWGPDSKHQRDRKVDLPDIVKDACGHSSLLEQSKPIQLTIKYEERFDGTLGDFDTDPMKSKLGFKYLHRRSYPLPQSQIVVLKK